MEVGEITQSKALYVLPLPSYDAIFGMPHQGIVHLLFNAIFGVP